MPTKQSTVKANGFKTTHIYVSYGQHYINNTV